MTSVLEDNFPGMFVKLRISFPKFHQCRQETTHAGLEKEEDRSQAGKDVLAAAKCNQWSHPIPNGTHTKWKQRQVKL